MSNLKNKLEKIVDNEPSAWMKNANARKNTPWLKAYSSQIARRIITVIRKRDDLSQSKLAETLNVSPQQISKIVQGKENMTLETIFKLSKALDYELISFPPYEYTDNNVVCTTSNLMSTVSLEMLCYHVDTNSETLVHFSADSMCAMPFKDNFLIELLKKSYIVGFYKKNEVPIKSTNAVQFSQR